MTPGKSPGHNDEGIDEQGISAGSIPDTPPSRSDGQRKGPFNSDTGSALFVVVMRLSARGVAIHLTFEMNSRFVKCRRREWPFRQVEAPPPQLKLLCVVFAQSPRWALFLHNRKEHHRRRELTLPGSGFTAWTLSPSGSELVLFPVVYEEIPGGSSRLSRG